SSSQLSLFLYNSKGKKTKVPLPSDDVSFSVTQRELGTIEANGVLTVSLDKRFIGKTITVEVTYKGLAAKADVFITASLNTDKIKSLELTPPSISGQEGETVALSVIGTTVNDDKIDLTTQVQWELNNDNVSISPNSKTLNLVNAGDSEISARFFDITSLAYIQSNQVPVRISPATLTALHITPNTVSIPMNSAKNIAVQAKYSNGLVLDVTDRVTWNITSNNVIISGNKITGKSVGGIRATATFQSLSATLNGEVTPALLKSIVITPHFNSVPIGVPAEVRVFGVYSDGSKHDVTDSATLELDNNDGIQSTKKGTYSSTKVVTINIKATLAGLSDEGSLNFTDSRLLTIETSHQENYKVGELTNLQAVGRFSDNTTRDLSALVQWNIVSDPSSILSRSSSQFHLAKLGNDVVVQAEYNGIISNLKSISVTDKSIINYEILTSELKIPLGEKYTLKTRVYYSDGTYLDNPGFQVLTSDNSNVSINHDGMLTSFTVGKSVINGSVDNGKYQASATVYVVGANVTGVTITGPSDVQLNQLVGYEIIGQLTDGTTIPLSAQCSLVSDDSNTSTLVGNSFTPKSEKVYRLSTSCFGFNASKDVNVTPDRLDELVFYPNKLTITQNFDEKVVVYAKYSSGTIKDVTNSVIWDGNNDVTITQAGVAKGLQISKGSIAASYTDPKGSTIKSNLAYDVVSNPLQSIKVNPSAITTARDIPVTLNIIGVFQDGSEKNITHHPNVSVTGSAGLSINQTTLSAGNAGTYNFEVHFPSVSSTRGVFNVVNANLVKIVVPDSITLGLNETEVLTASGVFDDGNEYDISAIVTWNYQGVNQHTKLVGSNQVNGVSYSLDSRIYDALKASYQGMTSNQLKVYVNNGYLNSIEIIPSALTIPSGLTHTYKISKHYSNGVITNSTSDINWICDSSAVCRFTGNTLTALNQGVTTVKAMLFNNGKLFEDQA
ncbi:hypothetical protein, partial [Shewanella sp.]|uniref:hypothetical protein n=1 Tax=Shewanella sp. TaxID=50422 RepID=UPI000E87AAB5